MNDVCREIIECNIDIIKNLPTPIPSRGRLASYGPDGDRSEIHSEKLKKFLKGDNKHYPMGHAFYKYGVSGIASKALERANSMSTDNAKKDLLLGIHAVYNEISAYFRRYGEKLLKCSDNSDHISMGKDLIYLSSNPPATFKQALQLIYSMWCIRIQRGPACIGRLDVALYPYYVNDLEKGIITKEEAYELLKEMFLHLNEWGSGDTLMNVVVGGSDIKGNDQSSDLSVMMLDICAQIKKTEPHISVRYHKNIRPDVMEAAYRLQLLGYGQAAIYNDDVIIPSMVENGIPPEIACRYANDGCTEIVWDGLGRIKFNHIDVVATLELVINGGHLLPKPVDEVRYVNAKDTPRKYIPHVTEGFDAGDPESCKNFDEFYDLFLKQYDFQMKNKMESMLDSYTKASDNDEYMFDALVLNGSFEEVLESGININCNSLPMDSFMVFLGSIPSVADCLESIRVNVFEKGYYTIREIKAGMVANFQGYDVMRARLLAAPKFGNDIDSVDYLSASIVSHCCDYFERFRKEKGFNIWPALCGWRFVEEAYSICASADGRRVKEPIAEHYCPTPGKAVRGVTSVINSIAKAPLARCIGIAPVHLSLPRNTISCDEKGLEILRAINGASLEKGLMEYNIAIYDSEVLKDAQVHPELHEDLIVRVWGFSARFIDISAEMQDHVIQRALRAEN